MSRLEEIKEVLDDINELHKKYDHKQADTAKCYFVEKYGKWLINRVEELEAIKEAHIEELGYVDEQLLEAQEDNRRYKQALETISEHATDDLDNYVTRYLDFKFIARQALEADKP